MGDFAVWLGEYEPKGFRAEGAEGALKFALAVIMSALRVYPFIFKHCCAIVKKRVMPRTGIFLPDCLLRDFENFSVRDFFFVPKKEVKVDPADICV